MNLHIRGRVLSGPSCVELSSVRFDCQRPPLQLPLGSMHLYRVSKTEVLDSVVHWLAILVFICCCTVNASSVSISRGSSKVRSSKHALVLLALLYRVVLCVVYSSFFFDEPGLPRLGAAIRAHVEDVRQ